MKKIYQLILIISLFGTAACENSKSKGGETPTTNKPTHTSEAEDAVTVETEDPEAVKSCMSRIGKVSKTVCDGVKTMTAANAVVGCLMRKGEDIPEMVCQGVKTDDEASAVISCIINGGDIPPMVCQGVRTRDEANAVLSCVMNAGDVPLMICQGVKNNEDSNAVISCVIQQSNQSKTSLLTTCGKNKN